MKIGFFGNTNNYPFILARAFRSLGHDVSVVVNRPEKLHRPEFRYSSITVPYPDWIHDIQITRLIDFCRPNRHLDHALRILRECDLVVLNELGPALASRINKPTVALLTGSDLGMFADPAHAERALRTVTKWPVWARRFFLRRMWKRLISYQREGIAGAQLVYHYWRGISPSSDVLLDELKIDDRRRIFQYMTDLSLVSAAPIPNNKPLRTFCATRLTWRNTLPAGGLELDYKGSDVMIRGIAQFHRASGQPLDVQLIRKGQNVAETVELIENEGIQRLVTWSDEISQQEVWERFQTSDIIFEQLGKSMIGMAGIDAMAVGRPVIANARPDFSNGETLPVCQAATPEEVCAHLQRLTSSPENLAAAGAAGRAYVEKNCSAEAVAQYILQKLKK